MQDNDFDPVKAQQLIRSLRVENRQLRARLRNAPQLLEQDLPMRWQKTLLKLRNDCKRYRLELRAAEAELTTTRNG